MFFKIPTQVYLEENCVVKNGSLMKQYGQKALIVTGHSSAANGSLADLETALKENQIKYLVYDKTLANPPVEQVMEIQSAYRDEKIDFVIGLGGGSAMDLSKAVAVMLYYPEKGADFLYDPATENKSLPVVAIPTTCGTGSEVTAVSVLTRHDIETKAAITSRIYPALALLDGSYLKHCPQHIVNNTSIDAFGHLVESYINRKATAFSDMVTEEGFRTWSKVKETLLGEHFTAEDCQNLMLSANYAGMAIAHCGTSLPHGASYIVTYNTGIPHGKAVGYFQYGYLKCADPARVNRILELTGFASLEEMRDFIIRVCKIDRLDEELLEKCFKSLIGSSKLEVCPFDTSEETLRKVVYSL